MEAIRDLKREQETSIEGLTLIGADLGRILEIKKVQDELQKKADDVHTQLASLRPGKNYDDNLDRLATLQRNVQLQRETLDKELNDEIHAMQKDAYNRCGELVYQSFQTRSAAIDSKIAELFYQAYELILERHLLTEQLDERQKVFDQIVNENGLNSIGSYPRLPWGERWPGKDPAIVAYLKRFMTILNGGCAGVDDLKEKMRRR